MFDLSSGKLIVIALIALIVVGPKELPGLLRQAGRMMTKLREMAGEFRQQFDEAMREAELEEVKNTVNEAASIASSSVTSAFDPLKNAKDEIGQAINSIHSETSSAIESGSVVSTEAMQPDVQSLIPSPPEPAPVVLPEPEPQPEPVPKPRSRKKVAESAAEPAEVASEPAEEPKPKTIRKKKTVKVEEDQA